MIQVWILLLFKLFFMKKLIFYEQKGSMGGISAVELIQGLRRNTVEKFTGEYA